ncbi:MAG: hypothetical protein IKA56_03715 [Clostridia bacterium]|nr:hypothetical protein [Clostridia bacterium]
MKLRIIAIAFLLLFTLSACAKEPLYTVDSFIEKLNAVGKYQIGKEDFIAYINKDKSDYCTELDGILLTVTVDSSKNKVSRINLCGDNTSSGNMANLAKDIINCLTDGDTVKAVEITDGLNMEEYLNSYSFYKSYIFEKDLTYGFISTDAGNLFYANFNEFTPVSPTEIPEFQENYTLAENRE